MCRAFQVALAVRNLPSSAGDLRDSSSVPQLGRSPGEGHGNPLQYSFLKNPMDRGDWWATVHRVAKSQTQLKRFSTHARWSGYLALLQGIVPTQGSNPGLPHSKHILYQLSYKESPNEPILTHNYQSKFIVYIRVHSWWCSFYGFWQMYDDGIHHYSSI